MSASWLRHFLLLRSLGWSGIRGRSERVLWYARPLSRLCWATRLFCARVVLAVAPLDRVRLGEFIHLDKFLDPAGNGGLPDRQSLGNTLLCPPVLSQRASDLALLFWG